MKVLIANQEEVKLLFPMPEAIGVMEDALRMLAGGDALLPLRTMMLLPDGERLMGLMPSYLEGIQAVGVKVIAAFPGNEGSEYDTHQGVVLFFDTERGLLQAVLDGTSITAIRTAAVSGLATRLLANEDAGDLAIIGAGTQACTHLEAMLCVRPIRRVRVYSRHPENTRVFAERESRRHGIPIEVATSALEAVQGADLICTVTSATEPVLLGEWLSAGAHINAVGAFKPTDRELDSEAVVHSRLYVDRRESTMSEAGEFLIPRGEGVIGDEHIVGELGELLLGIAPGRRTRGEITLFKSLGIAIEDLASAHYIHKQALEKGIGTWVEIGGRHFGKS